MTFFVTHHGQRRRKRNTKMISRNENDVVTLYQVQAFQQTPVKPVDDGPRSTTIKMHLNNNKICHEYSLVI